MPAGLFLLPKQDHFSGGGREFLAVGYVENEVHGGVDEAEQQRHSDGDIGHIPVATHVGEPIVSEQQAGHLQDDRGEAAHDEHDADADQSLRHLALLRGRLVVLSPGNHLESVLLAPTQSEQDGARAIQNEEDGEVAEGDGQHEVVVEHHEVQVLHGEAAEGHAFHRGVVLGAERLFHIEQQEQVEAEGEGQREENHAGDGDSLPGQESRSPEGIEDGDVPLDGDQTSVQPGHGTQNGSDHDGHGFVLHLHVDSRHHVKGSKGALGHRAVPQDQVQQVGHGQTDEDDAAYLPHPLIAQDSYAQDVSG